MKAACCTLLWLCNSAVITGSMCYVWLHVQHHVRSSSGGSRLEVLASHTSYEQSAAAEASEKASLLNGMVGIDAPHLTILAVCACWD